MKININIFYEGNSNIIFDKNLRDTLIKLNQYYKHLKIYNGHKTATQNFL